MWSHWLPPSLSPKSTGTSLVPGCPYLRPQQLSTSSRRAGAQHPCLIVFPTCQHILVLTIGSQGQKLWLGSTWLTGTTSWCAQQIWTTISISKMSIWGFEVSGGKGVGAALRLGAEDRTFSYVFHKRKNENHSLILEESQIKIRQKRLEEPMIFFQFWEHLC